MDTTLPIDTTISVYVCRVRIEQGADGAGYRVTVLDPLTGRTGSILFPDQSIGFLDFMTQKLGKTLNIPEAQITWNIPA